MNSSVSLEELLEKARDLFSDKALQNSQRILLLITLYMADRLIFTDLARVTGIDKGRLEYHLRVLEERGYIVRKRFITIAGPRLYIAITREGREKVREVLRVLSSIAGKI